MSRVWTQNNKTYVYSPLVQKGEEEQTLKRVHVAVTAGMGDQIPTNRLEMILKSFFRWVAVLSFLTVTVYGDVEF